MAWTQTLLSSNSLPSERFISGPSLDFRKPVKIFSMGPITERRIGGAIIRAFCLVSQHVGTRRESKGVM